MVKNQPLAAILAIFVIVASAAWVSHGLLLSRAPEWIRIAGSQPTYTLAELEEASEAIAVVRFESNNRMFWNNQTNSRWEPQVASGTLALIYRDDSFAVLDTLKGRLPDTLVVRGVGGHVRNVHMDFEGQVDWVEGSRYLLFLRRDDTPFDVGTERMWTVVWTGSGSFALSGDRWMNADHVFDLSLDDVADLRN